MSLHKYVFTADNKHLLMLPYAACTSPHSLIYNACTAVRLQGLALQSLLVALAAISDSSTIALLIICPSLRPSVRPPVHLSILPPE